jgi:hypothetical protein
MPLVLLKLLPHFEYLAGAYRPDVVRGIETHISLCILVRQAF